MTKKGWYARTLCALAAAATIAGCAAAPVALLPAAMPALLAGAGGGISYTFTNVAYKTMTRPAEDVEAGALLALARMSIAPEGVHRGEHSTRIKTSTRELSITVDIERMTATLTRMKVNVKRGLFFKDKNTAFEIIFQTEVSMAVADAARGMDFKVPEPMQQGGQQGR